MAEETRGNNKTLLSDVNPPVGRNIKREPRQRRLEHAGGKAARGGAAEAAGAPRTRRITAVLLPGRMSAERGMYGDPEIRLQSFHLSHHNEG